MIRIFKTTFNFIVHDHFVNEGLRVRFPTNLFRASPLAWAALCCILLLAAYFISYRIQSIGIYGFDTFEYLHRANLVLHEGYTGSEPRYTAYLLDALALLVFGYHDWAARALIGGFYLANVTLVFFAVLFLCRRGLAAAFAAGCYAFLPAVQVYARNELTHTFSATFLLWAALSTIWAVRSSSPKARLFAAACTGFFGVLAIFTHEDLAFAVAGMAVSLALMPGNFTKASFLSIRTLRELCLDAIAMTAGAIIAFCISFALMRISLPAFWHGVLDMRAMYRAVSQGDLNERPFYIAVGPRIIYDFAALTLGYLITAAVLLATLALALLPRFNVEGHKVRALATIPIIIICYLIGLIFIGKVYVPNPYVRFLMPLVGPVIIMAASTFALLMRRFRDETLALAIMLITVGLLAWYGRPQLFDDRPISFHRQIFDAAVPFVGHDSKVLLPECYGTPLMQIGASSFIYLGDNAVPLFSMEANETIESTVANNRIRYILVLSQYWPGGATAKRVRDIFENVYRTSPPREVLASASPARAFESLPDSEPVEISKQICDYESSLLHSFIAVHNGSLAAKVGNLGDLYRISPLESASGLRRR
jgi:hypothetical protein